MTFLYFLILLIIGAIGYYIERRKVEKILKEKIQYRKRVQLLAMNGFRVVSNKYGWVVLSESRAITDYHKTPEEAIDSLLSKE